MRVLNYLELATRLDRSGIGTATDHQRKALAESPHEVVTSPWPGRSTPRGIGRMLAGRGVFEEIDLVHCNLIGPGSALVARRAIGTDTPLILHSHVTAEDFAESFRLSGRVAPLLRHYLRWFYSQADLVLCPSEYTRSNLVGYPVDAPIRPISNGVDAARLAGFEELRVSYRERYDLEGPVVFSVGNVFERKGLTRFCELAMDIETPFVWFGPYDDGPQASRLVKRWTRDPPANVRFTGWIDDIRGAYGAGDIYCFPTKDENQGIAVLEAMACGKPVVLSELPVFHEYFEDGVDCLLCSSHEEFRQALERLIRDPALRARLGANARETAAEHSLERLRTELEASYSAVLAAAE